MSKASLKPLSLSSLTVAVVATLPSLASAAGGDLLWDVSGGQLNDNDGAEGVVVVGERTIVYGSLDDPTNEDSESWYVAGLDSATGAEIWGHVESPGGHQNEAQAAIASGNLVIVAGEREDDQQNSDLSIRAYNATNGTLAWSAQLPYEGTGSVGIGIGEGKVYVGSGIEDIGENTGNAWLVAAYELDGTFAWQDIMDSPGNDKVEDTYMAVADGRVSVVGDRDGGWFVRTYSTANGNILWSDELTGDTSGADAVEAVGGRVFVAGSLGEQGPDERPDALIRAYNAADGSIVWQDVFANADYDELVSGAGLVIAGGERFDTASTRNQDGLVRAYDHDGEVVWQDIFDVDSGGEEPAQDDIDSMYADGASLVVAGEPERDSTRSDDWMIRVYDIQSGQLRWQDLFDDGGAQENLDDGFSIDVSGNTLVATGEQRIDQLGTFRRTRAYDLGASVWTLNHCYALGDMVTYNGVGYRADIAHCAFAPDWNPEQAQNLWTRPAPSQPGAWTVNTAYALGDRVSHGGQNYRCISAHTSYAGWTPDVTPALWTAD